MNRLGLKNNVAIHVPTQEQWVKVIEILGRYNYKWHDGSRMNEDKMLDYDCWYIYRTESAVAPMTGENESVEYFENNGFDLVEASDFIDEYATNIIIE